MQNTSISPLVYSPDEYDIVALPDHGSAEKIVKIQNLLKELMGDSIWLTPSQVLHSTLMEIICDTEYRDLSREEHFMQWCTRYNDIAREVIAQFQPIDITLSELRVSPAAIILKAADPGPFNVIRQALLKNTVLPTQTKIPPDIIHCTIARYSKEVCVDDIMGQVSSIPVNINFQIREFKLMKDLGPDFHPTVLQTYRLGA
ncbi:MAG TPA: 2'-5' RNA ligase family protein [Verrucomicrobiae bacterium]|nr:2'-5' RNA ligase family protein [Verrucomicrobiae bacterium]